MIGQSQLYRPRCTSEITSVEHKHMRAEASEGPILFLGRLAQPAIMVVMVIFQQNALQNVERLSFCVEGMAKADSPVTMHSV